MNQPSAISSVMKQAAARSRTIDYPIARTAFVFTGLWFVIGAIVLWSPVAGALGIGGELFAVWLMLFFLALAASGSLLTVASLNMLFPPHAEATGRAAAVRPASPALWTPHTTAAPPAQRHAQRDG